MLFSSLVFVWFFLPTVFLLYHLLPWKKGKDLVLLLASLFFYAWGEPRYILLMLASIGINYLFGLALARAGGKGRRRLLLLFCLAVDLGLLGYFKYFNFFAQLANLLLGGERIGLRQIVLPIGISFYTFQALSYVIDVYRRDIPVQRNLFYLALYIAFFPQLIAGPIVKYHDIEGQIARRETSLAMQAYGIKRFSYGLGKKVILANTFAQAADQIFDLPAAELGTAIVWFGVLVYTLQIYFDFSGYSDMAIGLGKMFGFHFMENFNYPYLSVTVSEFWRRWHISLSTWFRQYLYIPLGGNRKGLKRTCINLFLVFCATGLWHGASITFVLWGIYYGILLIAEKLIMQARQGAGIMQARQGAGIMQARQGVGIMQSRQGAGTAQGQRRSKEERRHSQGDLRDHREGLPGEQQEDRQKSREMGQDKPQPSKLLKGISHLYTMLAVMFGWMLFRAEHLGTAKELLLAMVTWRKGLYPVRMYGDPRLFFWMAVGICLCGPLQHLFPALKKRLYREEGTDLLDVLVMAAVMAYSILLLVSNTYNPFIYFRF